MFQSLANGGLSQYGVTCIRCERALMCQSLINSGSALLRAYSPAKGEFGFPFRVTTCADPGRLALFSHVLLNFKYHGMVTDDQKNASGVGQDLDLLWRSRPWRRKSLP